VDLQFINSLADQQAFDQLVFRASQHSLWWRVGWTVPRAHIFQGCENQLFVEKTRDELRYPQCFCQVRSAWTHISSHPTQQRHAKRRSSSVNVSICRTCLCIRGV